MGYLHGPFGVAAELSRGHFTRGVPMRTLCDMAGVCSGAVCRGGLSLAVALVLMVAGCRTPDSKASKSQSESAEKADVVQPKVEPMPPEKASVPAAEKEQPKAAASLGEEDVMEGEVEEAPPMDVKPQPGEDPQTTLLRILRDQAEARVMWARSVLARESEIKTELDKLVAEEARLGVLRAIPETQDDASVEAEWQGVAQIMGFKVGAWFLAKSNIQTRPLPKEVPADKEFELLPSDIRSVYQVVVTIPRLSDADLTRLLDGVKGFQRLTLVRRIKRGDADTYVVNAEVYLFNPTDVPKFIVPERTIEAAMSSIGIHMTVSEAVRKDPIGYVQTAALAFAEYQAAREKVARLAVLEGQILWLKARRAFWEGQVAEQKALKLTDVLKPATVGGK